MNSFTGIAEAAVALNALYWSTRTTLDPAIAEKIEPLLGQTRSPVDAAVKSAEIIYANRAILEPEWLDMGAALAVVAELHGFHGMDVNSRGSLIGMVLRGQPVEVEPEAKSEFVLPEREPEPAPVPPLES